MYIQATVFDDRMPTIPGSPQIRWQGIGDDAGYCIVEGDLDGQGSGFFITNQIAGRITGSITVDGTTENLDNFPLKPDYHYPKVEWLGRNWRATHLDDNLTTWTLVHTRIPGWYPREWLWYDQDHQHTEDPSEISRDLYCGDQWMVVSSGGVTLKGEYARLESGDVSVTLTYSWQTIWKHDGGGTAPAGEYSRIGDSSNKRTVGYWNEDNEEYEINSDDSGTVNMFSFGLVRVPNYQGLKSALPTSWSFNGADWSNPDPLDWRYWYCIRQAILERESLVYMLNHSRMGTLISNEEYFFDISPLSPPTQSVVIMYRKMLTTLAKNFVDYGKAYELIADRNYYPTSGTGHDAKILLDGYEHLTGGWEIGDTPKTESLGDLTEFLKEAKAALESMVITPLPEYCYAKRERRDGWAYGDSDDTSWNNIYSDSLADAAQDPFARWTYDTSGAYMGWSNCQSDVYIHGSTDADRSQNSTYWESNIGKNDFALLEIDLPSTSIIDGSAMGNPQILWIRESHKGYEGVEVGDIYYGEEVTANEYWADNGITEGVATGTATLPFDVTQNFPSSMPEPDPPSDQSAWWAGCTLMGNETIWWCYCFWGNVLKFTGPMPPNPSGEEDEGEEEEPEPAPQPQPEPQPEPSPSSRQAVDWEIASDVDDARELKGPGPYRLRAREDAYTMSRDGDGTPVLNPNLKYHYPVKWGTEESLFQKGKRYVTGWRKSWWLYSKEVPKLEVDELLGWVYYVFQTRPFVAYPSNKQYGAPNLSTMPTESIWEQFHRQTQRCINGPYSLPTVCYA